MVQTQTDEKWSRQPEVVQYWRHLKFPKIVALSGRGRETCSAAAATACRRLVIWGITHLRKGKEKEKKSLGGEGVQVVVAWPHNHARGAKPDSTLTGREQGAKEGAKQASGRSKAVARSSRLPGSSRASSSGLVRPACTSVRHGNLMCYKDM